MRVTAACNEKQDSVSNVVKEYKERMDGRELRRRVLPTVCLLAGMGISTGC